VKPYDLIYVAQLIDRKCPLFVVEVMNLLPDKTILVIGDGPRYEEMAQSLRNATILRNVPYAEMAAQYQQAKIALLPTLDDSWMLTATEAMACGLPVLTTDYAGCADDLVWDECNGYVRPMVARWWAHKIRQLLDNPVLLARMSKDARDSARKYTYEKSAEAIWEAIRQV
jgi:glycosyltransferase involved in cell wall biosynthesis